MVKASTSKKSAKQSKAFSRTADFAIQGFLYQFNKTLLTILEASDTASIVVEGIIEDIDVHEPTLTTAIQCKYHETKTKFTLSVIYKPILEMMNHYLKHPTEPIDYRIYCYCPGLEDENPMLLTVENINDILGSTNKDFKNLISKVKGKIDAADFTNKLRIDFGMELEMLIASVHLKLGDHGFSEDDVPKLIYPNAIHAIASMSIEHDVEKRRLTKQGFLKELTNIRKTMISRWTLMLKTKARLMKEKRSALKTNLSKNVRLRTFVISKNSLSDFDEGIVVFISEYIDKYHSKPSHIETPIFCIDCDEETFSVVRDRIYEKNIKFTDGFIGNKFQREHFVRPSVARKTRERVDRDFSIRLLRYGTDPEALDILKCDDLFLISEKSYERPKQIDLNTEHLATEDLLQTKYLLGISDVYE